MALKVNYNVLETELNEIACFYFVCKRNEIKKRLFHDQSEKASFYLLYIYKVNDAYANLNTKFQEIINNDFFYRAYPGWWMSSLNKNEYRRQKRKAVQQFLENFHEKD